MGSEEDAYYSVAEALTRMELRKKPLGFKEKETIYSQGDDANNVFYLEQGRVKITVVSRSGKEAVLALLGENNFFGEGCLTGQRVRLSTAIALTACAVISIDKTVMRQAMHKEEAFSNRFVSHLLSRNQRIEEDLVDQLFNSSEKRLARILLLLANFGKEGRLEPVLPKISQATLAEMVGTTRPRVNQFMNKFRDLGFIDYNDTLEVHSSLLNVILND
jgi:CRP/FNR family cyclic AMP-dependent transcriptional regulator